MENRQLNKNNNIVPGAPEKILKYPVFFNGIPLEDLDFMYYTLDPHDREEEIEGQMEYDSRKKLYLSVINDIVRERFTEQQRKIFLMFFGYRVRQQEIAKIFHISQPHVAQCLKKCIKKIKKNLIKENGQCLPIMTPKNPSYQKSTTSKKKSKKSSQKINKKLKK